MGPKSLTSKRAHCVLTTVASQDCTPRENKLHEFLIIHVLCIQTWQCPGRSPEGCKDRENGTPYNPGLVLMGATFKTENEP